MSSEAGAGAASHGGCAIELSVGLLELVLPVALEGLNAVAAVKVLSDLLVGHHEDFELLVELAVLLLKDRDVLG